MKAPVDDVVGVVAVAAGGAVGFVEEPFAFVVAQRLGGDVGRGGEFTDQHRVAPCAGCLTFQGAVTPRFAPIRVREGVWT